MGAIVFGRALPGCRMARLWHLMRLARVRLPMDCGGAVLSAVGALHRRRPDARYAQDTEHQHYNASAPTHS